eukprot:TRINITY_DN57354_c0_g1_i1.p1 TRINITY_DN57354_c0_g1~~TRINITY_DN57354_c0_g1_i1.p1  ORF type:complete len:689 (+),score=162.30 TRINITY_DN57354_c0_g1_i1:89-2155(+)
MSARPCCSHRGLAMPAPVAMDAPELLRRHDPRAQALARRRRRGLVRVAAAAWLAGCQGAHASSALSSPSAAVASEFGAIVIPAFMDCTGAEHEEEWRLFGELFRAGVARARAEPGGGKFRGFPDFELDLAREALRLLSRWEGMLPVANEDYPGGSASFYHSCHFGETSSYCLYGHLAALVYLARHSAQPIQRFDLASKALRLISWNHCLDYIESSSWGFSLLDLWDLTDGHLYPQVTLMHQVMAFGPGTGLSGAAGAAGADSDDSSNGNEEEALPNFWIFEFGTHKALSNEPVSMIEHALPGHKVVHMNFQKAYEGRAEAFIHPFPRECSPNCKYQQESVPYTFPVFEDMEGTRAGFHAFLNANVLSKPEVRRASVFLCTNPTYHCSFFTGLDRMIIGYFGLPLLYMVPHAVWDQWLQEFVLLAASPQTTFFVNNPLLAEQVVWQTGVRLRVLQPVVRYLHEVYHPVRRNDVLVPEPREACVLNCLLRAFTPAGYPLRFFGKADTDRTFRSFMQFRALVLFPHDVALMSFYEFYALAMPLFLPSHLSKYIFPFSATVPLLDRVPTWLRNCSAGGPPPTALTSAGAQASAAAALAAACREPRPSLSPLSLTTVAALRHWSKYMDFFRFPGVQLFESLAALLQILPAADTQAISVQMRLSHMERHVEATNVWRSVAAAALNDAASAALRS